MHVSGASNINRLTCTEIKTRLQPGIGRWACPCCCCCLCHDWAQSNVLSRSHRIMCVLHPAKDALATFSSRAGHIACACPPLDLPRAELPVDKNGHWGSSSPSHQWTLPVTCSMTVLISPTTNESGATSWQEWGPERPPLPFIIGASQSLVRWLFSPHLHLLASFIQEDQTVLHPQLSSLDQLQTEDIHLAPWTLHVDDGVLRCLYLLEGFLSRSSDPKWMYNVV